MKRIFKKIIHHIIRIHLKNILFFYLIKFICYFLSKRKQKIFIFCSDLVNTSDNAFFLFQYFKNLNYKCFFIFDKYSKYTKNIKKENIIFYNTFKHCFLIQRTDFILYEQNYYFPQKFIGIKKDKIRAKKIFIQHGIIQNNTSIYFNSDNFDLFITSALKEQKYVMKMTGCNSDKIKLTGLARFDNVYNNSVKNSKMILIMPTWRQWLWFLDEKSIIESQYIQKWSSLLKNKKLNEYCKKNSYDIVFYPHYRLRKCMGKSFNKYFKIDNKFANWNTHDFLINCAMLVTDYSSVAFDVAYQMKPVLYYQFDQNIFFSNHLKRGYYDYKNGLGYYYENEIYLVNRMIYVLEHGLTTNIKKRINNFFYKIDNKNCQRIYEAIMNL